MKKCTVALCLLLCLHAGGFQHASADEVTTWNEIATLAATVTSPLQQSRLFAMTRSMLSVAATTPTPSIFR